MSTRTSQPKTSVTSATKKGRSQACERGLVLPRSINPWDQKGFVPWAERQFPQLKNEFRHLADSVFNFAEDELIAGKLQPAANVAENSELFVVTMDLPGFDPDAIEVRVTDDTLTVAGERETDCCESDADDLLLHRNERRCGKFTRSFSLPNNVSEDVTARCENGVLTIKLAKSEPANTRKIEVHK